MTGTLTTPTIDILGRAWAAHVEQTYYPGHAEARDYMYASARRNCLRRAVLEARHPEAVPSFDSDVKARLLRGSDRERDLIVDMNRVGRLAEPSFVVIGQQERIAIADRRGRIVIKGRIDGKIRWQTGEKWSFEVKSWSPFLVERIHVFDDLFANIWTASGAYQILSYLFASNEPYGLLILDRPGLPRLIDVALEPHLDRMEQFLADATVVRDHIDAGTLPDFIHDAEECRRCPLFGGLCQPPIAYAETPIIVNEEWIEKLERWHATKEAGEEHEALDKAIKKQFRGTDLAIAGGFLLEGTFGKSTGYDIPDEIKKKYVVIDPKGRFTLKITKI